ncbi:MAG: hypothetical protein Q9225_005552 [Loekoesia sp. 1 TL-2023]
MEQPMSLFLRLPAEIRVLIYRHILVEDGTRRTMFSIASVSRLIRKEAVSLLRDDVLHDDTHIPITISPRKVTILGKDLPCSKLTRYMPPLIMVLMRNWFITIRLDCFSPLSGHARPLIRGVIVSGSGPIQMSDLITSFHVLPEPSLSREAHDAGILRGLEWIIRQLRKGKFIHRSSIFIRLVCGCYFFGYAIECYWLMPEKLLRIDTTKFSRDQSGSSYEMAVLRYVYRCQDSIIHPERQRRAWNCLYNKAHPYFDQSYELERLVNAAFHNFMMDEVKWKEAMQKAYDWLKQLKRTSRELLRQFDQDGKPLPTAEEVSATQSQGKHHRPVALVKRKKREDFNT